MNEHLFLLGHNDKYGTILIFAGHVFAEIRKDEVVGEGDPSVRK
jgi:hypothetical protein